MEELEKEKADIQAKILTKQKEAETATTAAHWLKKRLKVVEAQISAMQPTDGETLKEVAEGLG